MATQNINLPYLVKADTEEQLVESLRNEILDGALYGNPIILSNKSAIVYRATLVEAVQSPPSKITFVLKETK